MKKEENTEFINKTGKIIHENDLLFKEKLKDNNYEKILKQKNFTNELEGDKTAILMTCPEIVIEHLAKRISSYNSAVEICCGIGLTSIKIAEKIEHVIGIDIDEDRIEAAVINAKKYGVESKTSFIVGDVLDDNLLQSINADVAVLDPEWGTSKNHENTNKKELLQLTNPQIEDLYYKVKNNITDNIVVKVPNTFNFEVLNYLDKCVIDNIIWNNKVMLKYVYFSNEITENKENFYYFDI